jgi:acyl transferase domain-containing protein
MNDTQQRFEGLSPERRALLTIRRLQLELEALKKERTEPIAIIGMSCRFPGGANSPEAFWQLLVEGRDAITEVPSDRYDINEFYDPDIDAPGKTISRWGGFLDSIDQFDPMFFGISPREATYLDPQQRLLLEVTWEAIERAGLPPEKLHGSQAGVFIGLFNRDYFDMQLEQMVYENAASANPYTGIGNGPSFAAGRLSYLLGLQGPSMVVDTVCSSSLVAVHLACQSLHNNECNLAFAGATNLIFYPLSTIVTSKMRALSPQGRSKTFDASADGFVRGEGCAVVILKRLSKALADGDPILALIRGSAVNQDGRSSGLTAPNGLAQQAVIQQALSNAGLTPEQISYIEAHGTGTVLGDPIEVEALKAVMGQPRANGAECVLGSVKTNIGHLESCAGMAGLIKTVLCLQHGIIPPVLHLKTLNPHISLKNTPFVIPTSLRAWPQGVERRYAGVSGAGLSGTNAHVVLEEAPELASIQNDASKIEKDETAYLLPLSARDPQALKQLARAYQRELTAPGSMLPSASLRDICYTASTRRTHYACRIALVAQSHEELASQLETFAEGEQVPGTSSEAAGEAKPGPVFMFAGQGTQWVGMGRQLFEQEPVFRALIEECDALLRQHVQWSLLEELQVDEKHSRLHETGVAQPALFAIQVALAALWRSWGILPGGSNWTQRW